ncbi:MAG: helix-turn-helix transcriptional regulator [Caldilineaceae bacterium]
MKRFGEKLRLLRKQKGMTIKEFANAIGHTTHSHISEFETGKRKPSLEFALRVSAFFVVPLDQLVKDELDLEEL